MHSSSLSAYHLLADRATTVPTNIWMNLSPCKACANILMQEYNKTDTKPTIHYAQLHTSSNNDILSAVESIKCLVRLEREGFSVQVWNWSNFRDNYLSHSECVDQVNTELTTMEFVEAFMDLEQIDAFVHELAQHGGSVANTWCSLD